MTDNSKKVSELPVTTNAQTTDRILILKDPSSAASVRTISIANLATVVLEGVISFNNTAVSYSWSNTQTFNNTVTFNSSLLVGSYVVNSTGYSGTANNVLFASGSPANTVVNTSQLQSNLSHYVNTQNFYSEISNYQHESGLAANVVTLTSNNTLFVGSIPAANIVSNAQLQSNLSHYQTTEIGRAHV